MAKTKSTRSTGADTKGPNETAPKNGSMEAANFLPNLDDSALATLTQRIEQKLQGRSGTKKASQKAPERPVPYSRTTKGNTASEKQIEKKQTLSKGKKRNRNGDVINSEEKTGKKTDGKNETLRREILALGGGEEDYNMLMGVDSASELEYHAVAPAKSQSQPSDGILRKELAKMLKETGKVEVEIDEEEDDGNMDSDGNSSDVEKSRLSEAKSAPTPGAIAGGGPSKGDRNKVPKEYSKLVGRLVSIGFHVFNEVLRKSHRDRIGIIQHFPLFLLLSLIQATLVLYWITYAGTQCRSCKRRTRCMLKSKHPLLHLTSSTLP
jgi:hypothetical protein